MTLHTIARTFFIKVCGYKRTPLFDSKPYEVSPSHLEVLAISYEALHELSWPPSHSQTSLPTTLPPLQTLALLFPEYAQHVVTSGFPLLKTLFLPAFPVPGFSLHSNVLSLERLLLTTSSKIVPATLYLLAGCIFLPIIYIMHWCACCLFHLLECRSH